MSDLPVALPAELEPTFVAAFDPTGKLVAALAALGPVADRDVLVVDARGGPIVDGLSDGGGAPHLGDLAKPVPARRRRRLGRRRPRACGPPSAASTLAEVAEVDRVLRPGGRHLAVHDYGRDDVSRLHGDRPEYGAWSHRTRAVPDRRVPRPRRALLLGVRRRRRRRRGFLTDAFGKPGRRSRRRSGGRGSRTTSPSTIDRDRDGPTRHPQPSVAEPLPPCALERPRARSRARVATSARSALTPVVILVALG